MYYFSLFKTIFIVCFGVILFIFSHSSISSPITDYELSIGNLFKLVSNEDDSWDLKLMDVGDRNPSESWDDSAKEMVEFMDRLPEKKIQIFSLGKYHSDLFLIIGKDTSADNKWSQIVLRLNTDVEEVECREIFDQCIKDALHKSTSDYAAQGTEAYKTILDSLSKGENTGLAQAIVSKWLTSPYTFKASGGNIFPLDSDEQMSALTAKGIDDLVEEQGIKDNVIDITLLDRLSSCIILKRLPRYFLKEDSTEGALSDKGTMKKNMNEYTTEIMLPLLYLTPKGSLIPEIAMYNVQIRGRVTEVSANVLPEKKFINVLTENKLLHGQLVTVLETLSSPLHAYYTLGQITNNDVFKGLFITKSNEGESEILKEKESIPMIKKVMELINSTDPKKIDDDILEIELELELEQSQKLRHRQTSK